MAGTALRRRLTWLAARVADLIQETPNAASIVFEVSGWAGHRPGQHVDVRLTAEDGYQAQRSYSIATPAEGERVTITVERLPDGEVSPYLVDELRPGDEIELRGPIGGWFVWEPALGGPLQLVGGGSGVVPLMAMLRARADAGSDVPARLLLSSRSAEEVIYADELADLAGRDGGLQVTHALTRAQPPGWGGYARRIDAAMLAEAAFPAAQRPQCFVCGPTGLVEAAASALVGLGHDPGRVKTERFGPMGGS